jgi:4,5-dihydroxyphthalate decarboxylase
MPELELSLAISYYDHVCDLIRGRVRPEGLSLVVSELPVEEIFYRMVTASEWDASELSMAKYVSLAASGASPFQAIPVFPSRLFRHSAFYVAARAGIREPADLAGRRVGIPEWAQTAGVWARALLQHEYGLRLRDVHWFQGGINQAGRVEKVGLALPEGVTITEVRDRSLTDMLLAGDLDAVITAREPSGFPADPRIERLFPDFRSVERDYFRKTGVFPIMHVLAINASLLARHRWIARNLFKAFDQSKENSLRRLNSLTTSTLPFPWATEAMIDAQRAFGGDSFPYGIDANRTTLAAFLLYCHEQGLTPRRLEPEELFPEQFQASFKV